MDNYAQPAPEFLEAQKGNNSALAGSLHYRNVDVQDMNNVDQTMKEIASGHNRLDGLIAADGSKQVEQASEYTPSQLDEIMSIKYNGVFHTATSAARQMMQKNCKGSIILVASTSGIIADHGMASVVYNASKASLIQLTRCLAMEWGKAGSDGSCCIRVNCLCPGPVVTPQVGEYINDTPSAKREWEEANMLGRLSQPEEYRGAALFLLSDASSFMTGSSLVVDGGYTSW